MSKPVILVVDDNEINLEVSRRMIEALYVCAETASSGKEAVKMCRTRDYSLIFMDYLMPDMDGLDTLRHIRAINDYYRSIPVIAITADESIDVRDRMMSGGMDDYVKKPLGVDVVGRLLSKWIPGFEPFMAFHDEPEKAADLPDIPGISKEDGLRNSGGEKAFWGFLKSFCDICPGKGAEMTELLNKKDYDNLLIQDHSMKSTLRTIGALSLSDRFKALELALHDMPEMTDVKKKSVLSRQKRAIRDLRTLREKILPFAEAGTEKKKIDKTDIKAYLDKLLYAIDNFNIRGTDEAVCALKKYDIPDSCRKDFQGLLSAAVDFKSKEAREYSESILRSLNDN